jgi:sarcosine oxidase delta subunit
MISHLLQIGAVAPVAIYLGYWRATLSRRNKQSWETLIAKLRPDWSGRELSDHFLWKEGLTTTPDETWQHIHGARGLWAMYKNAGVMQEMAEYAARNSDAVDPELIQTLRTDAAQIRICALNTLMQCAVNHASENVRLNAFRAASMYTGMTARMTQLLQENAEMALPSFVAAM